MRRDAVLLAEIVNGVERILELTAGLSAVEIEVAPTVAIRSSGTSRCWARRSASSGLKAEHPAIPWMDASRIRNRIVHGYWSVDFEVLIATARDDLPSFLVGVETVLASLVEDAE